MSVTALHIAETSSHESDDPDLASLRLAATGDQAAFEQLYRRHIARIYALIFRMLGGEQTRAEDLTQEAFVKAWTSLSQFREQSKFGTWLHRLAVNTVLMDVRSKKDAHNHRGRLVELELIEDFALQAPKSDVDTGMDLEIAIAQLPSGARTILILYDIEGWQHNEIAQSLGIAIGTSKAQLHRARQLLKVQLGDHQDE